MAHWTSTPSHGYLYLSQKELENMPDYLRMARYEEDCDWAIAYVALPQIAYQKHIMAKAAHSPEHDIALAWDTFRWNFPDLYERFTGVDTTGDKSGRIDDYLAGPNDRGWDWKEITRQWRRYSFINADKAISIFDEWIGRLYAAKVQP